MPTTLIRPPSDLDRTPLRIPAGPPSSPPWHPLTTADRVRRWGTSSVSPFLLGPDREIHELPNGGVVGFVRRGRWAVMASDPVGPPGAEAQTVAEALELLAALGLRPLIAAAADAERYESQGMWSTPIADDALVDLRTFTLAGSRMANLRHSVAAARRMGLSVSPWSPAMRGSAVETSAQWLATKRGGEMGFTLGRFDPDALDALECRVALDPHGRVLALVTWHPYADGRARVLDLMRRAPDGPGSTMDLLLAECLRELADRGVEVASLGSVPRAHGPVGERVYPTRSLHRYKQKFAPQWEPRHLVVPARRHLPSGLRALAHAYSPDGMLAACRRNGSPSLRPAVSEPQRN